MPYQACRDGPGKSQWGDCHPRYNIRESMIAPPDSTPPSWPGNWRLRPHRLTSKISPDGSQEHRMAVWHCLHMLLQRHSWPARRALLLRSPWTQTVLVNTLESWWRLTFQCQQIPTNYGHTPPRADINSRILGLGQPHMWGHSPNSDLPSWLDFLTADDNWTRVTQSDTQKAKWFELSSMDR